MEATQEEMKAEAVDRMKKIGIFPEVIKQFEKDNLINESVPPVGACYWISKEQRQRVKDIEAELHGSLIYHVVSGTYLLGGTDIMNMECYLFVYHDKEDWKEDRRDIENPDEMQVCCYVYNATAPDCSELGAVGIEVGPAGGLLRKW